MQSHGKKSPRLAAKKRGKGGVIHMDTCTKFILVILFILSFKAFSV